LEKSKTYPNAWFPIDVLRSARNVIAGSGESATPQLSFTLQVQVNDQESWSFDTEEEFFLPIGQDLIPLHMPADHRMTNSQSVCTARKPWSRAQPRQGQK